MPDNDDTNVINFPRIGFNLNPTTTMPTTILNAPTPPTAGTTSTPPAAPRSGRRSPLDIVSSLRDPGLTQPVITTHPAPGTVPATFRSEPAPDLIGPRIGALSLAAILAVAIAALRGTHSVLSTWWENRQARRAETDQLREARLKHQMAMQNIGDKAAQQRAKSNSKVPSSSEFGRKTLGGRGGSKGGSSSSGSGSAGNRSGKSTNGSNGSKTKKGPKNSDSPGAGSRRTNTPNSGGRLLRRNNTRTPDRHRNRSDRNTNSNGRPRNRPGTGPFSLLNRRRNNRPSQQSPRHPSGRTNRQRNPRVPNLNPGSRRPAPVTAGLSRMRTAAARWFRNQQRTPQNASNNPRQNRPTGPQNNNQNNTRRRNPGQRRPRGWWDAMRARTQRYANRPGPQPEPGQTPPPGAPGPGSGPGTDSARQGQRRSPFQNAGRAAAAADPAFTVERDDYPGAQAKTWNPDALTTGQPQLAATGPAALTAEPGRHPQRPGTTRPRSPIPMPAASVPARRDPRLVKARHQAERAAQQTVGRTMDAQHETEITLDDTCDTADQLSEDAFTTHDQAARLSDKARSLRDTFVLFAEDLATNHNLIGPLFTAASLSFAESMELVARMADEMNLSSLEAAEKAETAGNEINDAYRPYNTATADAGLTTPSAPIHNEA